MKTKLIILFAILFAFTVNQKAISCQADFYITPTSAIGGFAFHDSSSGTYSNVQWTFGDGTSSTLANPTHVYNGSGPYIVCLTIWSNFGAVCQSSHCDTLRIGNPATTCNADFSLICLVGQNSVNFTNNSTTSGGSSFTSLWNFGDGTTSTLANPTHQYTTAGTYTICLTITDASGNCTDQFCSTTTVGVNGNCDAAFSVVDSGTTAHFYPNSNTPNTYSYQWTFGDGTSSTLASPQHNYSQPGIYYVCLTISSSFLGCTATECDTITISGGAPSCTAAFGYQHVGLTAYFSAGNPGTNITGYTWSFGDGTPGTGSSPIHSYANAGQYLVCLTISTSNGCVDSTCQMITVTANTNTCNANFTSIDTAGQVLFIPAVVNSGLHYYWTFGDGSSSTSAYPSHTYTGSGPWQVCLTVVDSIAHCSNQVCKMVNGPVINTNCQANFTASTNVLNNLVAFTNTSTGTYTNAFWSFGDGTSSTNNNPTHVYATSGLYLVCLTIYNNGPSGCQSSHCDTIVVGNGQGNLCIPQFYTAPDSTFGNGIIHFGIINICAGTQYVWSSNGTVIGSGTNPTVLFADTGWFYVCVTAFDANGAQLTYCDSVYCFRTANTTGISENANSIPFTAFPNPTNGPLTLEYYIAQSEMIQISIMSMDGREILHQEDNVDAGQHQQVIDTKNLLSGIYLISLRAGDKRTIARIVIQH